MTTFARSAPPRPPTPTTSRQLVVFLLDGSAPQLATQLASAVATVAGQLRGGLAQANVATWSVVFDEAVVAVNEGSPALTEDRVLAALHGGEPRRRFVGAGLSMVHVIAAHHLEQGDDLPRSVSVLAAFAGPSSRQGETVTAYASLTADPRVRFAAAALADREVEYSSDAGGFAPVVAGAAELAMFWTGSHFASGLRDREPEQLG